MNAKVTQDSTDGSIRVDLNQSGADRSFFFRSEDAKLSSPPEVVVASLLLLAMAEGKDLHVEGTLDPGFEHNLRAIQDIYTMWFKGLNRVAVHGSGGRPDEWTQGDNAPGTVATFFSGGVDSFYTLMKHIDEIDVLVYVHGFDVAIKDSALKSSVSASVRRTAERLGKRLIEVETTLRSVTETRRMTPDYHNWEVSHGSALASIAHLLGNEIDQIYIPASRTYQFLGPLGSHPLLDPLWSSDRLRIVHDGCEADRTEKCEEISHFNIAMEELRVCWQNPGGAFNCGKCEKCCRTMLSLKVAGALDRCATLGSLSVEDVASIRIRKKFHERYYNHIIFRLEQRGGEKNLIRAIRRALRRSALRRHADPIVAKIVHGFRGVIHRYL